MNQSRRRLLKKIFGVGAAIAVGGIVGFEYKDFLEYLLSPQSAQNTSSSSNSTESSPTQLSSTQSCTLEGRLFFDYNGNGIQDSNEPPIQSATVKAEDIYGQVIAEALTDSSGDYKLDIPAVNNAINVVVVPNQQDSGPNFRYMCTSPSDCRSVSSGYALSMFGNAVLNLGLMEGFITLPFKRGTPFTWGCYMDESNGKDIDWAGQTGYTHPEWHNGPSEGNDMEVAVGTPVVAGAPGIVKYVDNWSLYPAVFGGGQGIFLIISHIDGLSTLYAHLGKALVTPGQSVSRGETIGLSRGALNPDGTMGTPPGPHLHYELDYGFHGSPARASPYTPVDIFKSSWNPDYPGYWTKLTPNNDPQYFD